MTDFSKLLNPEQFAAATAQGGPILVLAAAGTGKTRTLVHRVAYLVENGVAPESILLLTFTNKAAKEMLERAEKLVGPDAGRIWGGTFHSICARFLRIWGEDIGVARDYRILDDEDQKKLLGEIIKKNVASPKDFPKKEIVAKMISEALNAREDIETVASRWQTKAAGFTPEEIVRVAAKYDERKKELSAMDFDDLLVNALRLLKESERVRGIVQRKFSHVLVDEYQDTNSLQAEFSDIAAGGSGNIMAVGDDFQCIYTWRGAQIENIIEFPDRWRGCRIIKLERNYRSVPQVLEVANSVMRDVPNRFEKHLKAIRQGGVLPRLYTARDSRSQAKEIVSILAEMRRRGYAWRDMAVLYRSHFHSIDIEKAVISAAVPYRLTSGTSFYELQHVKDVLAYLRLVADPEDELSFMRFISLFPGVGPAGAAKAWAKLSRRFDPLDPASREAFGAALGAKAKPVWKAVENAMAAAKTRIANGDAAMIVLDFCTAFYEDYLRREWDDKEADDRLDDVKELANDISANGTGLKEYLADIALLTNLDLKKTGSSSDSVTLSTVHQAKGMEWPVVIIPWLSEGMFPSPKAVEDGRLDEERRLFYVAVTRAKDALSMISPEMRHMPDGGEFPVRKSVFAREIPPELVEPRRATSVPSFDGGAFRRGGGYQQQYGYGPGGYSCGGYGGGFSRGGAPTWKTTWRR